MFNLYNNFDKKKTHVLNNLSYYLNICYHLMLLDCTLSTTDCTITDGECEESKFGYHIISTHLCHITGASAIEETTKIGYFKTVGDNYVSRNYLGTVVDLGGTPSACTNSGVINNDGKLCITTGSTGAIELSGTDNDIHLITNSGGIFDSDTAAKVAIKVAANSFTLDTTKNGIIIYYYCFI